MTDERNQDLVRIQALMVDKETSRTERISLRHEVEELEQKLNTLEAKLIERDRTIKGLLQSLEDNLASSGTQGSKRSASTSTSSLSTTKRFKTEDA